MAYNLFGQLLPFEWRSSGEGLSAVQFPITQMRLAMQQDLATHSVWGQDGERQEATGRKSLVITATIPFRNGIVPGKNESWGILYPDTYRDFLRATANRATGILVHPELGEIPCKVRSVSTSWTAEKRDGCDVEVEWVETLLPMTDSEVVVGKSPISVAQIAALDLDSKLRGVVYPPLPVRFKKYDPFALLNDIAKIGDKITLLEMRVAGKIENTLYKLDQIEDAFTRPLATARSIVRKGSLRVKQQGDRALTVANIVKPDTRDKAFSALGWPAKKDVNSIRNSLQDVRKRLLESGKAINLYAVPKTTTLASLTVATKASVGDLIKLNPSLAAEPTVKEGTLVRYYSAA